MEIHLGRTLQQAMAAHRSGNIVVAERLYRTVLQRDRTHPVANHNLGVLTASLGRFSDALPYLKTAIEANPEQGQFWIGYIDTLLRLGRRDEARAALTEGRAHGLRGDVVDQLDEQLEALRSLPPPADIEELVQAFNAGRNEEVVRLARGLTVAHPGLAFAWKALGAALARAHHFDEALQASRKAVELAPDDPEAHNNFGALLQELGRFKEAEAHHRRALSLAPDSPEAHSNLGNVLWNLGRLTDAEASCRRALAINAGYGEAQANLGNVLRDWGRLAEAEASYREAVRLNPANARALSNLGALLSYVGRLEEAEATLRQAIALRPDLIEAQSNLIFCSNYSDGKPAAERSAEAVAYGAKVSSLASEKFSSWLCSRSDEKVAVGFVSGDLRNHPVGYFLEGLLAHIDRSRFNLIAYPSRPGEDELTRRIKPCFSGWRPLYGLTDKSAAQSIHQDGVHVLIDLSGHTAHNRLPVFAYKPAPIQVTWLGYCGTTGLPEMDYLLGDPHVTPEAEERHFSERVWRLPETYICFTPPQLEVEARGLPALDNGFLTFGCFNNLAKIGDEVVAVWSDILRRVHGSKLFLKSKQLGDRQVVEQLTGRFVANGITGDRLIFEGQSSRRAYLEAFHRVDIALDPFPYPGATTTFEGLWMGVPFVTLRGDRFLSHNGEAIAINLGQADWIANDTQQYVERAVEMTSALDRLSALRARLRGQLLSSPLVDASRFARNFEDALSGMLAREAERQKGLSRT
jgi:protein O-GlcNAc transferase